MGSTGSPDAAAALRTGFSISPQPTSHLGVLTHSQCTTDIVSAVMPSHLCRR